MREIIRALGEQCGVAEMRSAREVLCFSIISICLMLFWNIDTAISQSEPQRRSVTRAEVDSLISSSDFFERYQGAKFLFVATDFDTTLAYETIIEGIQIENEELKKTGFHFKYFQMNPDQIFPIYVEGLAALSKNSPDRLRQYLSSSTGEMKEWLTVASGFLADEPVHEDIREIISTTSNIILKANALRAIAEYGDTSDVPLLTIALYDTLSIVEIDEPLIGVSDIIPSYNPVWQSAFYALNKLGYSTTWDENLNPIVTKKE